MASTDGSILIKTKIDTDGIKTGKKKIENSVNDIGKSVTVAGRSIKKLGLAIGAVFGINAIVNFSKSAIQASNELENALIGLQSIVEGQGKSFQKAKEFIEDYIKDGLVPASEAATAYKNLTARGYTAAQTQQVMTALKDSAAFGRQAHLSMGEAIASATEGLKNENSILVDNAGVTKNVSKMWQDYAKEIGVSTANLTQQQKIQAEVNGIMQETRYQTGDAAKAANTFSGVAASLSYAFTNLKRAVGDFLKPVLQAVIPAITTAVNWLTKLFEVLANITSLLFGKKISTSANAAAQNAQAAQEATAETLDNTNDLAAATKKANKQTDRQLAAFDEIQKITEKTAETEADTAGTNASGAGAADVAVELSDIDTTPINILDDALKNVMATSEKIKSLFLQGFWRGFGDMDTSKIENSLAHIRESLNNIFSDINVKQSAQKMIDSFIVAFGTISGAVSSIGISIATGLVGGFEKFLSDNENTIKNDLIQMFDIVGEINGIVADWWAAVANIFSVFAGENAQNLVATVLDIFYTIGRDITTLCLKIGRDVLELITKPIVQNQEAIKQLLNNGLGFLNNWWLTISTLISGALQIIQKGYDMFIKPIFDRLTELLTTVAAKVIDVWNKNILPTLNNLSNKFREVIEEKIIPAWDTLL